jgi:heme oxygenase
LPQRLRDSTRELHTLSERSGVMAELIHGRLPLPGYTLLLRNLHALYAALEAALAQQPAHAAWACVDHPAQHRSRSLEADLLQLHGPAWAQDLPLAAAAGDYVARLQGLGQTAAPALVAHVYTRSLGDLHGGQILQQRVAHMLALPAGLGTAFYDFGPEATVLALRHRLRGALADLPVTPAEEEAIVAEACWAFQQHVALFSELARP